MANRRELGSLASGIVGSFNSRNNDVDGYWGIGKLYKFVEFAHEKVVELDLLASSTAPPTHEFDTMLAFYRDMLLNLLRKRSIPKGWVKSAKVVVRFEAKFQQEHHFFRSAIGQPCQVECYIVDDFGSRHIAYAYNYCRPHDPQVETRSCR
ncbi:hypothetical protein [Vibrio ulleungensis]|uniref:Uncharacterized protein n=1 Tax=Vibrio ulleungensis TaxID=2807619 RepID=A0ABS2HF84_9VIBR|nr:hypothetical protein [Vibrio ulleungensis]MBM7035002.1 hypothetical protein [Vibrio ulleungensis]